MAHDPSQCGVTPAQAGVQGHSTGVAALDSGLRRNDNESPMAHFGITGSRSALEQYNFDRHWRYARTHTLHDPVRYKYINIGTFYLNGILPPRHGALSGPAATAPAAKFGCGRAS